MEKPYHPPQKILEKYANVLINFALRSGKGIKKGDIVRIACPESAKPLFKELRKAVYRSGGHVLSHYIPDDTKDMNFTRDFYELANSEQLEFFPKKYMRALATTVDHHVSIIAEANKHVLDGIDPKKIMQSSASKKQYMEWLVERENKGEFTWTVGLYGTPAMAREVGMTQKEYWDQITKACYLNTANPVKVWKDVYKKLETYRKKLDALTKKTDFWHIQGADVDLIIRAGEKRRWMSGSGRNIPSFELFTSPDWRGTSGWIKINQPLYRYGNLITGIELWFENGKVVKSKADRNEHILKEMISTKNADKIGEFSMTDSRFSKITKFMGETLYDENVGGKYGNTHIALGNSYHDCYDGDPAKVTKKEWRRLGYNNSSVHTDVISTTDRIITAHFKNGKTQVLYKDGKYQF